MGTAAMNVGNVTNTGRGRQGILASVGPQQINRRQAQAWRRLTTPMRPPAIASGEERSLFQVVLGQINRELCNESRAAPVRAKSARIDRCEGAVEPSILSARKRVTIALVQIGVIVAQVERELLPGEGEAGIPVRVALVGHAANQRIKASSWKHSICCGNAIERISGAQPPMANVSGYEPADPTGEDTGKNILRRAARPSAVRTRVEN